MWSTGHSKPSRCADGALHLGRAMLEHCSEKNSCGKQGGDAFRRTPYGIESLPMVGGGLDYSASFQRGIELIGKRWTGAVVKALLPGPARFNQLLAGIPGISDRVLTERLRELETESIVERLVDPGPPVRVSYRLTSRGRALEPVLGAVSDWAETWLTTAAAAVG